MESRATLSWRTSEATAAALGLPLTELASHHGGLLGGELGRRRDPDAVAARLREVLDGDR